MFVACVESQLESNWHLSGTTDGSLSILFVEIRKRIWGPSI